MTAQEAVERLLNTADLLHIGGLAYLISPVSNDMLDGLAMFGADADAEPEPPEDDGDSEPGGHTWAA